LGTGLSMVLSYGSGMAGEYAIPWACSNALTTYRFQASLPPYSITRNALLGFALGVQMMRAGKRCNRMRPPL
jgi:hypothetical protein